MKRVQSQNGWSKVQKVLGGTGGAGRPQNTGTEFDPLTWVSASSLRNYMIDDPLLDWLKLQQNPYMNSGSFSQTSPSFASITRDEFTDFIMKKGKEFEARIYQNLVRKLGRDNIVQVCYTVDDIMSAAKVVETTNLILSGQPIIYNGVVRNALTKTFGAPDLLVRSDWLNRICPDTIPEDQISRKAEKLTKFHYRVIDIKFCCLHLRADGKNLLNAGSIPAYKAQVYVYNSALGELQGYHPPTAYILGRGYTYKSKGNTYSGSSCYDKLGQVDFLGKDIETVGKAKEAIQWIKELKEDGLNWSVYPRPTRMELYPNMCNSRDSPYGQIKRQIAEKLDDITLIWQCGPKHRELAFDCGVTSWRDPACTAKLLGHNGQVIGPIVDKMLKFNRATSTTTMEPQTVQDADSNWQNPRPLELYLDCETISNVFDDFSSLPRMSETSMIFMIGIGWTTEQDPNFSFKVFTASELTPIGEFEMLKECLTWIGNKIQEYDDHIVFHWSTADQSFLLSAYERHPDLPRLMIRFFDVLALFKREPILIKGVFNFGLKPIVEAMSKYKLIDFKIAKHCLNGSDAMIRAWDAYQASQKSNVDVKQLDIFQKIISYNQDDCRSVYEILKFLRTKHVKNLGTQQSTQQLTTRTKMIQTTLPSLFPSSIIILPPSISLPPSPSPSPPPTPSPPPARKWKRSKNVKQNSSNSNSANSSDSEMSCYNLRSRRVQKPSSKSKTSKKHKCSGSKRTREDDSEDEYVDIESLSDDDGGDASPQTQPTQPTEQSDSEDSGNSKYNSEDDDSDSDSDSDTIKCASQNSDDCDSDSDSDTDQSNPFSVSTLDDDAPETLISYIRDVADTVVEEEKLNSKEEEELGLCTRMMINKIVTVKRILNTNFSIGKKTRLIEKYYCLQAFPPLSHDYLDIQGEINAELLESADVREEELEPVSLDQLKQLFSTQRVKLQDILSSSLPEKDKIKCIEQYRLLNCYSPISTEYREIQSMVTTELTSPIVSNASFEEKCKSAEFAPQIEARILRDIAIYNNLSPTDSDHSKKKAWLDFVLRIPNVVKDFPVTRDTQRDQLTEFLTRLRQTMNEMCFGMQDVKDKICDFVFKRIANPNSTKSILALSGPPGVGKTTLAKSLSKCLDLPLIKIALGGMTDETSLNGSESVYTGAGPGQIMRGIVDAKCLNPIVYLDEVDKTGKRHGTDEVANALTHILDWNQNDMYVDSYVGFGCNLSQVFWILTFNNENDINPILRDRMNIIHVKGYSNDDKFKMVKSHLLQEIVKNLCLEDGRIVLTDEAIKKLICLVPTEEGVRHLQRGIEHIYERLNRMILTEVGIQNPFICGEKEVLELYKQTCQSDSDRVESMYI